MLDLACDGGAKRRRSSRALAQQQAEGVRVVTDKFHKGGDRGADHAAAFGYPLARLAHQLAQHQSALIDHRQAQLIDVAKMTIKGRRRDPCFPCHFTQAQAGETPLSAKLAECRFHQRTAGFFFLLCSYAHHDV